MNFFHSKKNQQRFLVSQFTDVSQEGIFSLQTTKGKKQLRLSTVSRLRPLTLAVSPQIDSLVSSRGKRCKCNSIATWQNSATNNTSISGQPHNNSNNSNQ